MWKLAVGFIVFAALAIFVISKGGDSLDMSGEKHGSEATHAAPGASEAASSAPAAMPAASAASSADASASK